MRIGVAQSPGLALEHAEAASSADGCRHARLETESRRTGSAWTRSLVLDSGVSALAVALEFLACLAALTPLVLFSILCLMDRELMSQLLTDPVGRMLVASAITLGFLWVRKIVNTEP